MSHMGRALGNGNIARINAGLPLSNGTDTKSLTLWHLVTNDLATAVQAANFFDPLAKNMEVGDIVMAAVDIDGTPQLKNYIVTANDGTTVTLALQTVA